MSRPTKRFKVSKRWFVFCCWCWSSCNDVTDASSPQLAHLAAGTSQSSLTLSPDSWDENFNFGNISVEIFPFPLPFSFSFSSRFVSMLFPGLVTRASSSDVNCRSTKSSNWFCPTRLTVVFPRAGKRLKLFILSFYPFFRFTDKRTRLGYWLINSERSDETKKVLW